MITDWLAKIEDRIADCSDPDVVARVGEKTAAGVKEKRIVVGYYQPEDDDDAIEKMPFFVVSVPQLSWRKNAYNHMQPSGAIEISYFEHARNYVNEVPNTHVQNELSYAYFVDFFEKVIYAISGEADVGDQLGITGIRMTQLPTRTPLSLRDPDTPNTDFWSMAFHLMTGQGMP